MKKVYLMMAFVLFITIILGISTFAAAAPFVSTTPFTSTQVTKCVFIMNSGAAVELAPVAFDAIKSTCKLDVGPTAINGNNVVSVQYKNIWGASTTVPFSFTKELPPNPSGMTLSES